MDTQKFGAGHAGGVDTFLWDRTVSENNDYKRVGIIDNGVCELTPDYYYDSEAMEFAKSMGAVEFVDIFVNMSEDRKFNLVENENTSSKILERLAHDNDWRVRLHVAKNPNTTVNILEKLASDKDETVKMFIAQNQNTPVEILKKLSLDNNEIVRESIALNLNTPAELLKCLTNDENRYISESATKTLSNNKEYNDLNEEFNNMVKDLKKNQQKSDFKEQL